MLYIEFWILVDSSGVFSEGVDPYAVNDDVSHLGGKGRVPIDVERLCPLRSLFRRDEADGLGGRGAEDHKLRRTRLVLQGRKRRHISHRNLSEDGIGED